MVPLHASLPAEEQARAFRPTPRGTRKVVLCTNVAETSLTVDDCCLVIDSGRQKSAEYDALNATSELRLGWTPLASRKQRRGRAGRTRAGQYWALYTRATHRALPAHG